MTNQYDFYKSIVDAITAVLIAVPLGICFIKYIMSPMIISVYGKSYENTKESDNK